MAEVETVRPKRPAFQFYPGDWRRDPALRMCSLEARGLWIDIMCIMHECEPYGHLSVNGAPMTEQQVSRLVGDDLKKVRKLLAELRLAGVPSIASDGTLYSRRMVKDEAIRNARAAGGAAGAEHGIKGASHGAKGGRPRKERGDEKPPFETPVEPAPSSSSSSSPSGDVVVDGAGAGDAAGEPDFIKLATEACRAAGVRNIDAGQIVRNQTAMREWLAAGADFETDVIVTIRETVSVCQVPIHSLAYFDAPIRQAMARRAAKAAGVTPMRGRRGGGLGMAEPALVFDETPEQIAAREQRLASWETDDERSTAAH